MESRINCTVRIIIILMVHLNVKNLGESFVAGAKQEMSLTPKRLVFFRAFNSLYGSVGANFSRAVLKIITSGQSNLT